MNYFNTNNNPVYKTRTEHDDIKIFERINWKFQTINFFSLSMNVTNAIFPGEKPKILNILRAKTNLETWNFYFAHILTETVEKQHIQHPSISFSNFHIV